MKKFKVVILGCGNRSYPHAEAYGQIENAELVACCGTSREKREKFAAQFKIKGYADAKKMIKTEKPDMVHLVTNPDTRVELMTLVSELGVPLCTVEKPVATVVSDWKKLVELGNKTKTKFAVCHQFRWQSHLAKCAKVLRSGKLGKVIFVDMSAGMNITGQGTHTLNYGMSLNGDSPVIEVFGNCSGWDAGDIVHPGPTTSEAYIKFENGARGLWTSGPVSPRAGDPGTVWQHVRVAAYAEKGRVNFEEFGKWEIVSPDMNESGSFGGMDQWMKNNIIAQAEFHKAMFEWFADDKKVPGTNFRQSLHEWAVVLALFQSTIEGRPVEMKNFDPPENLIEQYIKKSSAKGCVK